MTLASLKSMLPERSKRVTGPIGVDFARDALHLVQMERRSGKLHMLASASRHYANDRSELLANPDEARALIRTAARSAPFRGNRVVSAVPTEHLRIIPVNYALRAGQMEAQVILGQMADRLQDGLSEHVIDYIPVRGMGGETERTALVAVARREPLIEYLEIFRNAGFKVAALEIGPVAIRRLVANMFSPEEGANVAVLNCGKDKSYLTMISGRRLLLDQEIEVGEDLLLAELSRALELSRDVVFDAVLQYGVDIDNAGAADQREFVRSLRQILKPAMLQVVDELGRVLTYAASRTRGDPVQRILLMGSLARWPGIDKLLGAMTHLPAEVFPDPTRVWCPSQQLGTVTVFSESAELAVASGLALRGVSEDG